MSYSEKCRECIGDGCLYDEQTGEPEICKVCEGTGYITIKDKYDRRDEHDDHEFDIYEDDLGQKG